MPNETPTENRQLRSRITEDGTLELSIATVPVTPPADDEVVVRVEAAPINPSDLGLLFGAADMTTAVAADTDDGPLLDETPDAVIADYVRSVQRLRELPVTVVHAGHDPSFGRERLVELCDAYLAKRA